MTETLFIFRLFHPILRASSPVFPSLNSSKTKSCPFSAVLNLSTIFQELFLGKGAFIQINSFNKGELKNSLKLFSSFYGNPNFPQVFDSVYTAQEWPPSFSLHRLSVTDSGKKGDRKYLPPQESKILPGKIPYSPSSSFVL